MMHYRKSECLKNEITKSDLPFTDCIPHGNENFLWMQVEAGTKVNNVISYARKALANNHCRTLVWSGSGAAIVKTVSCVEILKRHYPFYQVTRMCYSRIVEHWEPEKEGLEKLTVMRKIPSLHILITLEPINDSIQGLQKPNTKTNYLTNLKKVNKSSQSRNGLNFLKGKRRGHSGTY